MKNKTTSAVALLLALLIMTATSFPYSLPVYAETKQVTYIEAYGSNIPDDTEEILVTDDGIYYGAF